MPRHALIIEDSPEISRLISIHLRDMGFTTRIAADGEEGLSAAEHNKLDLVILDLMLPGLDGTEICRRIRENKPHLPIVILTAKSSELDKVLGLELGADDYITKPFSVAEFVARIRALFRRVDAVKQSLQDDELQQTIAHGRLHIDTSRRKVQIDDKDIELTSREFDLLTHFARHPGRVYTRTELLDQVWGRRYAGYEHTVNTHINRLRTKIESEPANPEFILTVWGVGYKFNE
jgi:DNA-binding response OmpR family regulator